MELKLSSNLLCSKAYLHSPSSCLSLSTKVTGVTAMASSVSLSKVPRS